ncbi:putative secreted protein [Corynebacterium diphtheriae INCA 402]|uniref:M23 family metallopeptidase n=1 Tax=Corynebacterium diphtheriae TaxID=1717 RepID=UPI000245AD30|nr:M23 family metallopeptidase [Corynebacterium diphtheriae]AEX46717.1 putative secreted protein [Corynebacterium diphtheriae INCA 402]
MKKILTVISSFLLALFIAQPASTTPINPLTSTYINPATGDPSIARVIRPFDKPQHNWLKGHRGVDLDIPINGAVRAANSGIIAFAGKVAGKPVISIDHPDGLRTTYQPVTTALNTGDLVERGEIIGVLAPSVDGFPGLHWGVLQGKDNYLNPLSLLEPLHIQLKPPQMRVRSK